MDGPLLNVGWRIDRTFGVDDLLAAPGSGPGPITKKKRTLTCPMAAAGNRRIASPICRTQFYRNG